MMLGCHRHDCGASLERFQQGAVSEVVALVEEVFINGDKDEDKDKENETESEAESNHKLMISIENQMTSIKQIIDVVQVRFQHNTNKTNIYFICIFNYILRLTTHLLNTSKVDHLKRRVIANLKYIWN